MLARSFLSAKKLGLRQKKRDALITVLHMLERGELVHHSQDSPVQPWHKRKPYKVFDMSTWFQKCGSYCGTVACIGGWAEHISGQNFSGINSPKLHELFCPPDVEFPWQHITVEQAAHALSNYLTVGEPKWDEVVAE